MCSSCRARKTRMWTYNGTFPGPTIRRPTGQTTKVTLVNRLPAADGELTLHNHGNHSTTESDGQPDDFLAAPAGGSVTYTYTGTEDGHNERGAMQWYHDHRMDVTGRNVWMGLAGMYIIDDPADPKTLPKGEFDVPLMLADRKFDANNQITYRFDHNGVPGQSRARQRRAAAVFQRRRSHVPDADPQRVECADLQPGAEQRPGVHADRNGVGAAAEAGEAHADPPRAGRARRRRHRLRESPEPEDRAAEPERGRQRAAATSCSSA